MRLICQFSALFFAVLARHSSFLPGHLKKIFTQVYYVRIVPLFKLDPPAQVLDLRRVTRVCIIIKWRSNDAILMFFWRNADVILATSSSWAWCWRDTFVLLRNCWRNITGLSLSYNLPVNKFVGNGKNELKQKLIYHSKFITMFFKT